MFSRTAVVLWSLLAFAGSPQDIKGIDVLMLSLDPDQLAQNQIQTKEDLWLEVTYHAGENGKAIHEEPGERLWWIGEHPLLVLGGSGLPLPGTLLDRASVWVEVRLAGALLWEGEIFPRKDKLHLTQDRDQVAKQLAKGGNLRFVASYLAEVANYMAGNSATVSIDSDAYKLNSEPIIDGRGINIKTLSSGGAWPTPAGDYMRFTAERAAFRAGGVDEPHRWFISNLGAYSTALGFNNIANAAYSVSMGNTTETYGEGSVAMGADTRVDGNFAFAGGEASTAVGDYAFSYGASTDADGDRSVAMGNATTAQGNNSVAMGSSTVALGPASFVAGSASRAEGISSFAMGFNSKAIGDSSIAVGNFNDANGDYSVALGNSNDASYAATAIGRYNVDSGSASSWLSADPLFTVGNGSTGLARHNAFEIAKNGFMQVRRDVDGAGTSPTHYVASIVNEETTQGGDVLALSVQPADPDASSNFITFFGGGTAVGAIDGNGSGGVAYKSGSADLAEWFPTNPGETIAAAEVVSFTKGNVTKNTAASNQAFVISTAPFLVGNETGDEAKAGRSLVALVGQVPVNVTGQVQAGDVLVPSGLNDGRARALRNTDGLLPIVGIALTNVDTETGRVTVLVGAQPALHPALARLIRDNQKLNTELAGLKQDMHSVLAYIRDHRNQNTTQSKERAE